MRREDARFPLRPDGPQDALPTIAAAREDRGRAESSPCSGQESEGLISAPSRIPSFSGFEFNQGLGPFRADRNNIFRLHETNTRRQPRIARETPVSHFRDNVTAVFIRHGSNGDVLPAQNGASHLCIVFPRGADLQRK